MSTRRLLLPLFVLLAVAAFAGCGSDDEGPFEGTWASATAPALTFEGSKWRDSEGDSGTFSFDGDYPVYTLTFVSGGGTSDRLATFANKRAFELCFIAGGGALVDCHDFVLDKPTVH